MSGRLRIALVQFNSRAGDVYGNAARILAMAREARDTLQADVVVFPEFALSGFPLDDLLFHAPLHRQLEDVLAGLKAGLEGTVLILGTPLHGPAGMVSGAVVLQEGGEWFRCMTSPVGDVLPVVHVRGVRLGILPGEDRLAGPLQGQCDLVLHLVASPFYLGRHEAELRVRQEFCRKHNLPLLVAGQVGAQDDQVFAGDSLVLDAEGSLQLRVPMWEEGIFPVEFGIAGGGLQVVRGECARVPSTEEQAYAALVCGLRDYMRKNGFRDALLGLSGGIDSGLALAIAVDALGAEHVQAVMMPSAYTAEMSREDARAEARALGVAYSEIPIEPLMTAFLDSLREEFAGTVVDTTEENLQARCRGTLLMAISNKKRRIVLVASNKSELAVGYTTSCGDMAGGFAVLKDVSKTLVYRLARYRNQISPVIPQRVIDRPPSAELAPDQQDTDSLPDYAVLDDILQRHIEEDEGVQEIVAAGHDEVLVRQILQRVQANEYKRRLAPPGVRITRRAFGRERVYPLSNGFVDEKQERTDRYPA